MSVPGVSAFHQGGGAGGGIGGSTGATDNLALRSDGVDGKTMQSSTVTIDDSGNVTLGTGSGGWLKGQRAVVVPGEDFDVPASQSNAAISNDGAGAQQVFSLPPATAGLTYLFSVDAAQNLVLLANGTNIIRLGASASTAGGTLTSNTPGSQVLLTCTKAGEWGTLYAGTWVAA